MVCVPVCHQLVSYRGSLNYSLVYDVPLDNEDHPLPVRSDIIIEVRKNDSFH